MLQVVTLKVTILIILSMININNNFIMDFIKNNFYFLMNMYTVVYASHKVQLQE